MQRFSIVHRDNDILFKCTKITIVSLHFTREGGGGIIDTIHRYVFPYWRLRTSVCTDWICNYNRAQFSNPLVTSQRARIGFGAARERARSRQGRSEAIGTLMTGITSWKILHLFSLSLVLSFISVSFRSRCFTYRDEYRWAGTSIVHSCVTLPFRLRLRFVGVMSRCIGRI